MRVLAHLLRVALGTAGAVDAVDFASLDVSAFIAVIDSHRVGAFLQHRLPAEVRSVLPPAVQEHLANTARKMVHRTLVRSAELVRIARHLQEAGIRCITIKGPLLSQTLYGSTSVRHAGDIDLLIDPSQLAAADQVMRTLGCRRSYPSLELTSRQWRWFQQNRREFEYVNDKTGVRIELGWRLNGLEEASFGDLFARGKRELLGPQELVRLPEDTEFLYLFLHGAGHGWFRLFWLVDIAVHLQRREVNWAGLMQTAIQLRVAPPVWQGSRLAAKLLGSRIPECLSLPTRSGAHVQWLQAEAERLMFSDETARASANEFLRNICYELRLWPRWRHKAAVLRRHLMSPSSWESLPLAEPWFSIYYAAAPVLWLRRRLNFGLAKRTQLTSDPTPENDRSNP